MSARAGKTGKYFLIVINYKIFIIIIIIIIGNRFKKMKYQNKKLN